jgi:hypothetical protein
MDKYFYRRLELAKKILGNNFLSQFQIIKNYKQLPKSFKQSIFTYEESFNKILIESPVMCVITENDKYIIRINPLAIIDDRLNHYFEDDLENRLGISSFNISLLDIAKYLMNKKSSVSENRLINIIKQVIEIEKNNLIK